MQKITMLALGGLFIAALLVTGTSVLAAEPSQQPPVPQDKLIRGHWSEKPEIMKNNHQSVLKKGMADVVSTGQRKADNTIERCVTCHVTRTADGTPVAADNPQHYCRSCHAKERVSIDCFLCHASLPASDPARMNPEVRNADTLKERLQQWQTHNPQGSKKP